MTQKINSLNTSDADQKSFQNRTSTSVPLKKNLTEISGCKIASLPSTLQSTAGNFYELYYPTQNICDFVLGDVMQKGLPAALVGMVVKTHLMRFSLPYFQSKQYNRLHLWHEDLLSPLEILSLLHQELTSQLNILDFSVSTFYGRFDFLKRRLTYVHCGTQKAFHYDAKNGTFNPLVGEKPPLSTSDKLEEKEHQCAFNKGDIFLFFSGPQEFRSPTKELYSFEHLKTFIHKNAQKEAETILNLLKEDLQNFTEKSQLNEELTLILFKFEDIPAQSLTKIQQATFTSHLSQIPSLRKFIGNLCKQSPDTSQFFSDSMQLAATEIFANIIKHAYEGQSKHSIVVIGELTSLGLSIEFADQGKPFDPTTIPHPEMTGEAEGGFGWHIIKSIVDEIIYQPKKSVTGWNHLSIFKHYGNLEEAMEFQHHREGETLIISPGYTSLDAREVKEFKQQITDLIDQEDASKVVLDLGNIQYIDSSGLGCLLSLLKSLHLKGGELKLANLKKPVRTIFELVAMHKIFGIFNSAEEAINSYK